MVIPLALLLERFEIVLPTGHKVDRRRLLGSIFRPLMRCCDVGKGDLNSGLGTFVWTDEELASVPCGDPEGVCARQRRMQVATDACPVIFAPMTWCLKLVEILVAARMIRKVPMRSQNGDEVSTRQIGPILTQDAASERE